MNSIFLLRALAAMEMPRERENTCRRAAGEPAIHADRSKDQRSNSQVAERLCENYRCDQKTEKVAGFFASLVELNHKYIAFTK